MIDGALIANVQISCVGIGLGEPLFIKLCINRLSNLLINNLAGVHILRDADPFVGMVFREIGPRHKVVFDVLS